MVKHILFMFLLISAINSSAQTVSGTVTDSSSHLPISNVQVISKTTTVLTDEMGVFTLGNISIGDKISFRIMGYETLEIKVKKEMFASDIKIRLITKPIDLRAVNIQIKRNYKNDSLLLRKEYAAVFAYKAPDFTDMFVKVDPSYRSPHANINPNSTASILKFNALSAFKLFGKKGKATSKFKSTLLKAEENNFIAQTFSKEKVSEITKLQGDSLINFMNSYRPSIVASKTMTGYDLTLYIKKSYSDYIKPKN